MDSRLESRLEAMEQRLEEIQAFVLRTIDRRFEELMRSMTERVKAAVRNGRRSPKGTALAHLLEPENAKPSIETFPDHAPAKLDSESSGYFPCISKESQRQDPKVEKVVTDEKQLVKEDKLEAKSEFQKKINVVKQVRPRGRTISFQPEPQISNTLLSWQEKSGWGPSADLDRQLQHRGVSSKG